MIEATFPSFHLRQTSGLTEKLAAAPSVLALAGPPQGSFAGTAGRAHSSRSVLVAPAACHESVFPSAWHGMSSPRSPGPSLHLQGELALALQLPVFKTTTTRFRTFTPRWAQHRYDLIPLFLHLRAQALYPTRQVRKRGSEKAGELVQGHTLRTSAARVQTPQHAWFSADQGLPNSDQGLDLPADNENQDPKP